MQDKTKAKYVPSPQTPRQTTRRTLFNNQSDLRPQSTNRATLHITSPTADQTCATSQVYNSSLLSKRSTKANTFTCAILYTNRRTYIRISHLVPLRVGESVPTRIRGNNPKPSAIREHCIRRIRRPFHWVSGSVPFDHGKTARIGSARLRGARFPRQRTTGLLTRTNVHTPFDVDDTNSQNILPTKGFLDKTRLASHVEANGSKKSRRSINIEVYPSRPRCV